MSNLKTPLVLSAITIALIAACCCSGLGGLSGLLGGVEFTTGDLADVPAYPGSSQTTDSIEGVDEALGFFNVIPGEKEWKHYTTTDSESDVLDWYADVLPDEGWVESSEDVGDSGENGATYTKVEGSNSVMLFVMVVPDTETHIVIGRITIVVGD
jgi:hypothetical protein